MFEELDKYGEIENLNVCDNLADHLVGNVYVKFKEEESAAAAIAGLAGRPYAGESRKTDTPPRRCFFLALWSSFYCVELMQLLDTMTVKLLCRLHLS